MKNRNWTSKIFGIALVFAIIMAMLGCSPALEHTSVDILDTSPTTIYVPDDYSTIQAAVNAASPSDTIIVRDGTYTENVNVSMDGLTIRSENGAEATTVGVPGSSDDAFDVAANCTAISGFTITKVTLENSHSCNITNNKGPVVLRYSPCNLVSSNDGPILLVNSPDNSITDNRVANDIPETRIYDGISLDNSPNSTISGNIISNALDTGISIHESDGSNITDNELNSNGWQNGSPVGDGIRISDCSYLYIAHNRLENNGIFIGSSPTGGVLYYNTHLLEDNTVNGKPVYYYRDESGIEVPQDAGSVILADCEKMTVKNLEVSSGSVGIELAYTGNSTISNNEVSNNTRGIYLCCSSNNDVLNNEGSNTTVGIYLYKSASNSVSDNNLSNSYVGLRLSDLSADNIVCHNSLMANTFGIMTTDSVDNILYLNNLINNGHNIRSEDSTNTWNSTAVINYTHNGNTYTNYLGNYWSDYTGSDADGDGIGDTPYPINSDADNYPLMEPFENYGIEPVSPWPMFQHDPQHTGRTPFAVPPSSELKSEVLIGDLGVYDYLQTPVVASDGVLYTAANIGTSGYLYAFYPNGTEKWSHELGYHKYVSVGSAVALSEVGGTVYVTYSGGISAVDIVDGEQRWNRGFATLFGDQSPVLVNDEVLYFVAGLTLPDDSFDICLISLDLDGNTNWIRALEKDQLIHFALPEEGSAGGSSSDSNTSVPTIGTDGIIYLGYRDTLFALNTEGVVQWQRQFPVDLEYHGGTREASVGTVLVADDGTIYAAVHRESDYRDGWCTHLHAIDPQNPTQDKWAKVIPTNWEPVPAIGFQSSIYITGWYYTASNGQSYLYAFNSEGSLAQSWTFTGYGFPSLLLIDANDTVYVLRKSVSGTAWLHIFDTAGYQIQVTIPNQEGHRSDALSLGPDGTLYVGGHKRLYAIGRDSAAPTVASIFPENSATDVGVDISVTASFSKPMDGSTITTESFTLTGTTVSGTVTYDPDTYTATFTPDADLEYDHTYTATLSTAITDLAANPLAEPYSWSFTTRPFVLPSVIDLRELPLSGILLDTLPDEGRILSTEFNKRAFYIGEEASFGITVKNTGLANAFYCLDLYVVNSRNELVATSDVTFDWAGMVFQSESELPTYHIYDDTILPDCCQWLDPSEEYSFTAHWTIPDFLIYDEYRLISRLDFFDEDRDWYGAIDTDDSFLIANGGTTYDDLPVLLNNMGLAFSNLEEEIEAFYSDAVYNEFFPTFISVKVEEYDQDINLLLTTSLREVKKQYGLVRINTLFVDNTGWDAMMDWASLETSAYTPSSFSGCWQTWGTNKLIGFAGHLTTSMLEEAAKKVAGWIFTKATGLPSWPLTIAEMAFDVGTCYANGHESPMLSSHSFLVYLPLDTEINLKARAYVDYTNAGSTVPVIWLPGVVEDTWSGVITEHDVATGPCSIGLHLAAERTNYDRIISGSMQSPGEIRVYDSSGEVTGLIDGEIVNTIPKSRYDVAEESFVIFDAVNDYTYEIAGKGDGSYGLELTSFDNGEALSFNAHGIPTTSGALHRYFVDWDALSQGEEGVIVQIDSDGDGIFERTITSDSELTGDEFIPGSGCFIATAAYGTPMAEEVQILRTFRDDYLLTTPLGQASVNLYYKVSPPIAEFITEHPGLKPIVRAGLVPAVAMSTVVVNTTEAQKIVILGLLVLVSAAVAIWAIRRRGRWPESA